MNSHLSLDQADKVVASEIIRSLFKELSQEKAVKAVPDLTALLGKKLNELAVSAENVEKNDLGQQLIPGVVEFAAFLRAVFQLDSLSITDTILMQQYYNFIEPYVEKQIEKIDGDILNLIPQQNKSENISLVTAEIKPACLVIIELKCTSENVHQFFQLAEKMSAMGIEDEAAYFYQHICTANFLVTKLEREICATSYYKLADINFNDNEKTYYEKALSFPELSVELRLECYFSLAEIYFSSEEHTKSLKCLQQFIDLASSQSVIDRYGLTKALLYKADLIEEITRNNRLLLLQNVEGLASATVQLTKLTNAIASHYAAVIAQPIDVVSRALRAQGYFGYNQFTDTMKKDDALLIWLKDTWIAFNNQGVTPSGADFFEIAKVEIEAGLYQDALFDFECSLELLPAVSDKIMVLAQRAELHKEMKNFSKQVNDLTQCIEYCGTGSATKAQRLSFSFQRAKAYVALGNKAKALDAYKKIILESDPAQRGLRLAAYKQQFFLHDPLAAKGINFEKKIDRLLMLRERLGFCHDVKEQGIIMLECIVIEKECGMHKDALATISELNGNFLLFDHHRAAAFYYQAQILFCRVAGAGLDKKLYYLKMISGILSHAVQLGKERLHHEVQEKIAIFSADIEQRLVKVAAKIAKNKAVSLAGPNNESHISVPIAKNKAVLFAAPSNENYVSEPVLPSLRR